MVQYKMWTIYSATNKINGKRYIGVTGRGLEYRKSRHIYRASINSCACPRFYDAIRKYGVDAFVWKVLEIFSIKELAYHHEFVLVEDLKPEYNAAPGGQVGPREPYNKRPVICLEDGIVHESATAAARFYKTDNSDISKNCNGVEHNAKGRHFRYYSSLFSEQERKNLIELDLATSIKRLRRVQVRKINRPPKANAIDSLGRSVLKRSKQIICLDDGKIFIHAGHAAIHYDLNRSSVTTVCLGQRQHTAGKHFAYVDKVGQRMFA